MQQSHQERTIRARLDWDPFIGNRGVTGTHRIDRNKAPATAFEFRNSNLHRIAVVIFGRAQHHKHFGTIQIRATKLPKTSADRVDHSGGHVDRAKATVGGVIRCSKLACKQTRERLHLVTSSKHRKFFRIGCANFAQTFGQNLIGFFPRNGLELRRTAVAPGFTQQRLRQARGRLLLHDS